MPGIVTKKFRLHNAKQFQEQFLEDDPTNLYLFISRTLPWPDESTPPTPVDSTAQVEFDVWANMLSLKKVSGADATFGCTRIDWTSNTVYQQYTVDTAYHNSSFYVMTDDYRVYKCLDNNGGAQSTVKPNSTSTSSFKTSDGYKWKFMFAVPAADVLKFLTSSFLPVKTLTSDDSSLQWDVQEAAVNSSIESVTVGTNGSGYPWFSGTLAAANSSSVTLGSSASSTDGLYVNSDIYIISGTGSGQLRNITGYNGTTKVAVVNTAFNTIPTTSSTFNIGPKVNVIGDGSGFSAYANVTSGSLNSVSVINIGQDYTTANVIFTSNGGSGGIATAHISPIGGHGSDPVSELFAHNVMMNIKLTGSETGTFMTENEYRVFGLISDPKTANGSTATSTLYQQTVRLDLTSPSSTFVEDEKIVGQTSGAIGYLVQYNSNTNIALTAISGEFSNTETLEGDSSGATAVINGISLPELQKFSGDVLYLENRSAISRDSSQTEDYKYVIRF